MCYNRKRITRLLYRIMAGYCYLVLLCGKVQAQYRGNSNDGAAIAHASAQNILPNIYNGGNNSGFTVSIPAFIHNSMPNIYNGGKDEGFIMAQTDSIQNRMSNIYNGGSNDGSAMMQPVGGQNAMGNIYNGGNNDGYVMMQSVTIQNPVNNIYSGGGNDGFAVMQSAGLQNPMNNIYNGGNNDGYVAILVQRQNPLNALPVKLLSFSGQWQGTDIIALEWQTSSEWNSHHFEVEKSVDQGNSFSKTGEVPAAGNTTAVSRYLYKDAAVRVGNIFYYRLKMVDKDGHFTYSAIVRLQRSNREVTYTIYPNPGSGRFVIGISGVSDFSFYGYRVFDNRGVLVSAGPIVSANAAFDITRLAAGNYYVQIIEQQKIKTTYKIILQH